MGLVGILVGLGLLVWLAFRGWSVLLLAPAAALIIVLAIAIYSPARRIGTTFPPFAGVAQYRAHSSMSRRRFSNRSPRR